MSVSTAYLTCSAAASSDARYNKISRIFQGDRRSGPCQEHTTPIFDRADEDKVTLPSIPPSDHPNQIFKYPSYPITVSVEPMPAAAPSSLEFSIILSLQKPFFETLGLHYSHHELGNNLARCEMCLSNIAIFRPMSRKGSSRRKASMNWWAR